MLAYKTPVQVIESGSSRPRPEATNYLMILTFDKNAPSH